MANSFSNPIVLDTFSAVIDVVSDMGFKSGTKLKINSIEWQTPTTTDHTALITDKVSGRVIFSEKCVVPNQSIIKYFHGAWVDNLYIAISGVGSGSIIVTLC